MSASCFVARTTRCSRTGCTCRSVTTGARPPSWSSGTRVRRPRGQLKPPTVELPSFGPCKRLDFELEMGVVIGQPSPMGEMLSERQAEDMIFGFTLLNDWSARDIQQWEYVPLGPFQAKAFATSISPWIVTREALEPFRVHGPVQDPTPLPYLQQKQPNNYDLHLDVGLRAAQMNEAANICRTNFKYMYWSSVQQLVHHASSGCAMNVGDLLGSGTISGPEKHQRGSLLEISWNGTEPIELASDTGGHFSKTAIRLSCADGARATATASALAKLRERSFRRHKPTRQRSSGGILLNAAPKCCGDASSRLNDKMTRACSTAGVFRPIRRAAIPLPA